MWLGRKYDPEYFDPKKVIFDDPDLRFRRAFVDENQ